MDKNVNVRKFLGSNINEDIGYTEWGFVDVFGEKFQNYT
jgi:hypothetical protein